jgi:hypothetical protein
VKNRRLRQAFYFDDFLGRTNLNQLGRNEDRRLVEFMEEVAANPSWRFILTTREYILNAAMVHSEALAHAPIRLRLCIVNLADYQRRIRAHILYNHLYYSKLSPHQKVAILRDRKYEAIVNHRNYNPRVIEFMTQSSQALATPATQYLNEFEENLERPIRVWEHAYKWQISEGSRHVLLVMATLLEPCLLAHLELAFWKFYRYRQVKFGFPTSSNDWEAALKELDGSFIATSRAGLDVIVQFSNPSIRDFLESHLKSSTGDVEDLLGASHFYEQYVRLCIGSLSSRPAPGHQDLIQTLANNLFAPTSRLIRHVARDGRLLGMSRLDISPESRVKHFGETVIKTQATNHLATLQRFVEVLTERWERGIVDSEDAVDLLRTLSLLKFSLTPGDFLKAAHAILHPPSSCHRSSKNVEI